MATLRSRDINYFTWFTTAEMDKNKNVGEKPHKRKGAKGAPIRNKIEKMESLLKEPGEQPLDRDFCKILAKRFNCSRDRAGNPALKWAEVDSWFQNKQKSSRSKKKNVVKSAEKLSTVTEACSNNELKHCTTSKAKGKVPDLSALQFEARSAKDGAWYDVETCLTLRVVGDYEVLVRFVGFGAEHDEWVNAKNDIRNRSLPLDDSKCGKLKVGDHVVCFQEMEETARYYDAHIVDIQRKMHDITVCSCLFLVRYNHDNTEERVQLSRLCCRPSY